MQFFAEVELLEIGEVPTSVVSGIFEKAETNSMRDCQSAEGGQSCILVCSAFAVPLLFEN